MPSALKSACASQPRSASHRRLSTLLPPNTLHDVRQRESLAISNDCLLSPPKSSTERARRWPHFPSGTQFGRYGSRPPPPARTPALRRNEPAVFDVVRHRRPHPGVRRASPSPNVHPHMLAQEACGFSWGHPGKAHPQTGTVEAHKKVVNGEPVLPAFRPTDTQ